MKRKILMAEEILTSDMTILKCYRTWGFGYNSHFCQSRV